MEEEENRDVIDEGGTAVAEQETEVGGRTSTACDERETKNCAVSWWETFVAFNQEWLLGVRLRVLTFDISLFGTDVFTDYWNGGNLIAGGDVIWGGIMVSLTFLPMTIALLYFAFLNLSDKEDRWFGVLLLLLLPLAVVITTPTYMIFIIVAGFAKLYKPVIEDEDKLLGGWLSGETVNIAALYFRMLELVGESYPQALLGLFIQIVLKTRESLMERTIQYVGIGASIISITKGCSDHWVRMSAEKNLREPALLEWLQASVYFLPHVLFRLFALSFVFAFLGYYSIIVLAIIALAGLCLALPEVLNLKWDSDEDDGASALLSLVLSLLAPISLGSSARSDRLIMKRTITSTTLCLLVTLLLIRTGPLLVEEDLLLHTNGLCHLNFLNSTDVYSECAVTQCTNNITETTFTCIGSVNVTENMECLSRLNSTPIDIKGHECKCTCKRMFLTFETFSKFIFPALVILGLYCLLDGGLNHCKDREENRTWCPTAYRMAERFPKEESWEAKKEKKNVSAAARESNSNNGDGEMEMVAVGEANA